MLSGLHSLSLTAIAIATGFAALYVFARFSDQAGIDLAKRKVRAHLYSFRLFVDEPFLIFRAQKELLIWNGRYLALLARPVVIISIPTLVLLVQMEAIYGHRTLTDGEAAIVTAQLDYGSDLRKLSPALEGRGITVETPPVRLPDQHQVIWRVRAEMNTSGSVLLRMPGTYASKTLQIGSGLRYISLRRVASLVDWLHYPGEPRLPSSAVRWIEVAYPKAAINILGWGMHWLIWFSIICVFTMFVFRRRFGVTF
jgi:hypothetical protein